MGQPTPRQSKIEAQISQSKQNNENDQEEEPKQALASTSTTHQQGKNKCQDNVIIHYTHENRFTSMKRDTHEIFREAFKGLGPEAVRLVVGHRNSPTIQRELIRKRSHMKLMTVNPKVTNLTIIFFLLH
jgi:predicted methyltransferase